MNGWNALALAAALAVAPQAASAAVIYSFLAPGGLSTYVSPGFVTADSGPHAFDSCQNLDGVVCGSVSFDVGAGAQAFDQAQLSVLDNGGGFAATYSLNFASGSFAQEGIYVINPVTKMAVVEVGDYAPGSVLYLMSSMYGLRSVITQGFAPYSGFEYDPASCTPTAPYACGSVMFSLYETGREAFEMTWERTSSPSMPEFQGGTYFSVGTFATPGIHKSRSPTIADLAVIPLPDPVSAAIPEPGAWAVMILGFFGAGAKLRHRRRALSQTRPETGLALS